MKRLNLHHLSAVVIVALFSTALIIMHRELKELHVREVLAYLNVLPWSSVADALVLTAGSYLMLAGYDFAALKHISRNLPAAQVLFASFINYAFTNNLGLSLLTGSSIRYRIYSAAGLSGPEIASIIAFSTLTFALGAMVLVGFAFIFAAQEFQHLFSAYAVTRVLGALLLSLVCMYLIANVLFRQPINILGWRFQLPTLSMGILQTGLALTDLAVAGAVLYVLLPPQLELTYFAFLGIYAAAIAAGVLSHVPGGLGIFESVVVLLVPPGTDRAAVLGGIVVYRLVYYVTPLLFATLLLGAYELKKRHKLLTRLSEASSRIAAPVMGFGVFVSGAILMLSGARPTLDDRLELVEQWLALPIFEASHMLASVIGFGLIIVSRGLFRRLNGAYLLTLGLLITGIVSSVLKGLDYPAAAVLAVLLTALLPARSVFYRRSSLLSERFSAEWIGAIIMVIAATAWLGFFSFKHVEYHDELWWEFAFKSHASRFLRALFAVSVLAMVFALVKLLRGGAPKIEERTRFGDRTRALPIVAVADRPEAYLALTGDKQLLFSDPGNAFIMYGVRGNSWVAMGDPIGVQSEWRDLIWDFRELSDIHDGRTVFYQVDMDHLSHYLDLGLSFVKLGEEGSVDLTRFSLQGSQRADLRHDHRRVAKAGVSLQVLPPGSADVHVLKAISDQWLSGKNAREKGFSLGFFDSDYLSHCPIAIVCQADVVVAFANLWPAAGNKVLSIDMMRYGANAPKGVMDFLFIELMLWARGQGYLWFSLGMAPLSGLSQHELAPLWHRLGSFVFRHGEHFYNFEGLRAYKEKFQPEWCPKYLVCPGGLRLPIVLADVAALISRGISGVFMK
jgi:phosphatidylglycerol lysyltransferase